MAEKLRAESRSARPSVSSAPLQVGRFALLRRHVLGWALGLLLAYAFLYVLLILAGTAWLTGAAPVQLPQGAGLRFSTAPLGAALQMPKAVVPQVIAAPLELYDVQLVWPLVQPWRVQVRAERGQVTLLNADRRDTLTANGLQAQVRAPFHVSISAASIDWRSMASTVRDESEQSADVTTFVQPKLTYSESVLGFGGVPQAARFTTAAIMLPTATLQAVVQVDKFNLALQANQRLPRHATREAVRAWHQAGGQLSLTEFNLGVIGIELLLAGDLRLNDALDLAGNMQLQISGIDEGYVRLGQMGIVPPQHYRLLGYLLQAIPQAGQQTFTLPVKFEKNKMFIGPAAAFDFGAMPWQVTEKLLETPVARPATPTAATPQMTPLMTPAPSAE